MTKKEKYLTSISMDVFFDASSRKGFWNKTSKKVFYNLYTLTKEQMNSLMRMIKQFADENGGAIMV